MTGDVRRDTRIVVQLEQRQAFFVLMGLLVLFAGVLVLGYTLGLHVGTPRTAPSAAAAPGRTPATPAVALTFEDGIAEPTPPADPLPVAPTPAARLARARAAVTQAEETHAATAAATVPPPTPPEALPPVRERDPGAPPRPPAEEVDRRVDEVTSDALNVLRALRADDGRDKPSPPPAASRPQTPGEAEVAAVTEVERRWTIQVGAFQERQDALDLLDRLRSRGHNPFLASSDLRERGRWYRVRVGRFSDRDTARNHLSRLDAAEGLKGAFVARM